MMHGQPIDSIISFFEFMGKLIAIMCGMFLLKFSNGITYTNDK